MTCPSSLVSLAVAATLTLAVVDTSRAQSPAPVPTARAPVAAPVEAQTTKIAKEPAAPKFRLIVWTNDRQSVLPGLVGATGPGGAALPTIPQVRKQAQSHEQRRPPGTVIFHIKPGSPASNTLSHLGNCKPPACAIEIDKLGANGQLAVSHLFSSGHLTVERGVNELEAFSFTYDKIIITNVGAGTSASDSWASSDSA